MRRLRNPFTLVELLVVIAIIMILLMTLMPALKSARDAAKRIYCQNNIRQIAVCETQYIDDRGGFVAPAYAAVSGTSGYWHNPCTLGTYLRETDVWTKPTAKVIFCPSSFIGPAQVLSGAAVPTYYASSYCMNYGKTTSFDYGPSYCPNGLKITRIKSPSTMLDFLDSRCSRWNAQDAAYYSVPDSYTAASYNWGQPDCYFNYSRRHIGNTANCAFFDGHVKSFGDLKQAYLAKQVNHILSNNW